MEKRHAVYLPVSKLLAGAMKWDLLCHLMLKKTNSPMMLLSTHPTLVEALPTLQTSVEMFPTPIEAAVSAPDNA